MKWASKVSLFVMGCGLAVASRPVSANPVVRIGGPEAGINPDTLIMAREDQAASFLAVLADPANAGMNDPATVACQMGRLNSLKALGLSGLGGVGEMAACDMDVLNAVSLALDEAVSSSDAMLVEGQAAQDMIAALLGLPMLGIDSLAAIDSLATAGEVNSALAALLTGEAFDLNGAVAELQGTDTADGITSDTTALLGSSGGAWYGGSNWMGGASIGLITHNDKHHGGNADGGGGGSSSNHTSKHNAAKAATAAAAVGAAVPLPSGVWAGIFLATAIVAAQKARILRPLMA